MAKRPYLNIASLDPKRGYLKDRLKEVHWKDVHPKNKNNKVPACQLCRWTTNRKGASRKYTNTAYCQECNVVLCLGDFWQKFHSVWDLALEKDKMCANCGNN